MNIVKVPFENSFDSLGCSKASSMVLDNFPKIFTKENGSEIFKDKLNLEEINLDKLNLEESTKKIYEGSLKFISKDKSIFLGGDGSMSYYLCKAFLDSCNEKNEEPFLIVFDAHSDCFSYEDVPNNRQWLRKLISDGFPKDKIILVGNRISNKEENDFLSENDVRVYGMKDLNDYEEICDIIMEQSRKYNIYLSIDIDVVDGSFVPGTNNPEPGGLTSRQLIYFIQRLNILENLKVIDLTEINPEKDINLQTIKLGSKLLGELISDYKNSH